MKPRIVYTTIADILTGISSLPVAYQVDEDYTCDWIFFTPSSAIDFAGTTPGSIAANIGIKVWREKKAGNRGWISGYNPIKDRADFHFSYAQTFEMPWQKHKVTSVIEFWGLNPTNATIAFSLQPYTEDRY